MPQNYRPIMSESQAGDIVLETQKTADAERFRNVSRHWLEKTSHIGDVLERLAEDRQRTEDLWLRPDQVEPAVSPQGHFCLELANGRQVFPEKYAVKQLGQVLGTGATYPLRLFQQCWTGDAEVLAFVFDHQWERLDSRRFYRFRIRDGFRLKAVLSDRFELVRNDWYLGVLAEAVPGGRLSHWRGNLDTLWGNLVIPDSIREETDSEYGAMVSLSNSEIGERALAQQPSLFRVICTNGCICGMMPGSVFRQKHIKQIDRRELKRQIVRNIHEQIPLAVQGIDRLLQTRSMTTSVHAKPLFAQLCRDFRIPKQEATAVLDAWHIEARQSTGYRMSLFAVINAFTRAGQGLSNDRWVKYDQLGGQLLSFKESDWNTLVHRASRLKADDVESAFASAV